MGNNILYASLDSVTRKLAKVSQASGFRVLVLQRPHDWSWEITAIDGHFGRYLVEWGSAASPADALSEAHTRLRKLLELAS